MSKVNLESEIVEKTGHGDQRRRARYRDLRAAISKSEQGFEYAYNSGVMGLLARPGSGRSMMLGNGKVIVDFARGSYLGLDTHPRIVEGAISALRDYGALQCNSARTRLTFNIANELEEKLTELFRSKTILSALVMTANMAVLPLIASGAFTGWNTPVVVFDRFAHATLAYHKPVVAEDADVITIQHNDLDELESICKRNKQVAYICDGVYSMGGQAPIKQLLDLQSRYGLFLFIDDAHGTSVFGDNGEGYARELIAGDLNERTIIAASLGKAFGAAGAALLLGSSHQERLIIRFGVPYAFAIGPNVAAIGAGLASVDIHKSSELASRQRRLRSLLAKFDSLIRTEQMGRPMPIRMIVLGDEKSAVDCAQWLLSRGFYLTAAFFPTVARGKAGLRLCLTADHTEEQITEVAQLIQTWAADHSTVFRSQL